VEWPKLKIEATKAEIIKRRQDAFDDMIKREQSVSVTLLLVLLSNHIAC